MGKGSSGASAGQATGYAVDTAAMQAAFAAGADEVRREFPRGLEQFQNYAEQSLSGYLKLQGQANQVLVPFSDAATAAVGDLRYFLGLPGLSPTANTAAAVRSAAQQATVGTGNAQYASIGNAMIELSQKMDNAEKLSDPSQRQAASLDIYADTQSIIERINTDQEQVPLYGDQLTAEDKQRRMSTLENLEAQFRAPIQQFQRNYDTQFDPNKRPDPQEITDRLTQLPEYQMKLQQGTQAMERSQAARGVLQSGNALIEAQQFGQGLAESAYQSHISQVSGLLGITMPAAGAMSQNMSKTGDTLLQTQYNMGQTRQKSIETQAQLQMQNNQMLGGELNRAAISTAGNYTNASIANAQMQTQASMQNAQSAQSSQQGMGALAGMGIRYAMGGAGGAAGGSGGFLKGLFV